MKPENAVEEPVVAYGDISSPDQLDPAKLYSYADYFRWKFTERVELIKGFIYKMSPAASSGHQSVSLKLTLKIGNYFENKSCRVFAAPFDVRLPDTKKQKNDEQVFTVIQPDICVVCDAEKIDERGCVGAPDLVIEILSPGNTQKEMGVKFNLYEETGVREYWLVQPEDKIILVYVLENGRYYGLKPFTVDDEITSTLFPALQFKIKEVFE